LTAHRLFSVFRACNAVSEWAAPNQSSGEGGRNGGLPDIVGAIVNGRNPPQLTAKKLMRLSPHLPIDWTEQRRCLGFR